MISVASVLSLCVLAQLVVSQPFAVERVLSEMQFNSTLRRIPHILVLFYNSEADITASPSVKVVFEEVASSFSSEALMMCPPLPSYNSTALRIALQYHALTHFHPPPFDLGQWMVHPTPDFRLSSDNVRFLTVDCKDLYVLCHRYHNWNMPFIRYFREFAPFRAAEVILSSSSFDLRHNSSAVDESRLAWVTHDGKHTAPSLRKFLEENIARISVCRSSPGVDMWLEHFIGREEVVLLGVFEHYDSVEFLAFVEYAEQTSLYASLAVAVVRPDSIWPHTQNKWNVSDMDQSVHLIRQFRPTISLDLSSSELEDGGGQDPGSKGDWHPAVSYRATAAHVQKVINILDRLCAANHMERLLRPLYLPIFTREAERGTVLLLVESAEAGAQAVKRGGFFDSMRQAALQHPNLLFMWARRPDYQPLLDRLGVQLGTMEGEAAVLFFRREADGQAGSVGVMLAPVTNPSSTFLSVLLDRCVQLEQGVLPLRLREVLARGEQYYDFRLSHSTVGGGDSEIERIEVEDGAVEHTGSACKDGPNNAGGLAVYDTKLVFQIASMPTPQPAKDAKLSSLLPHVGLRTVLTLQNDVLAGRLDLPCLLFAYRPADGFAMRVKVLLRKIAEVDKTDGVMGRSCENYPLSISLLDTSAVDLPPQLVGSLPGLVLYSPAFAVPQTYPALLSQITLASLYAWAHSAEDCPER